MEFLPLGNLTSDNNNANGVESDSNNNVIVNEKCSNDKELPFGCSICGFRCTELQELERHMIVHLQNTAKLESVYNLIKGAGDIIPYNEEDPFQEININDFQSQVLNQYQCSQCEFKCNMESILRLHMKTHKDPFICKLCDRKFCNRYVLKNHERKHHKGGEVFTCPLCDFKINKTSKILINAHRLVHSREFGENFQKYEHIFNNATEKIIKLEHKKIEPQPTTKRFSCPICNSRLAHKCNISRHMRIHTGERPFSCEECDSKFIQLGHLSTHMLTHKKEKLFSCLQCEYKGINQIAIRRHMISHSDEKPFKCTECKSLFKRRHKLLEHVKKFHQE